MKFIVQVKENGVWEDNGDGPMNEQTALRVAREIRKECGVQTRVVPANALIYEY